MFKREARQFVRFVRGQLPQNCSPFGFAQSGQRGAPIGKHCHDRSDGAGMTGRQTGIDCLHGCAPRGALAGGENAEFRIMQTDNGATAPHPEVALFVSHFGGRPVFEDTLAWPAQGVRYWSRSHPLPRSRSFQ